ncbi:MAG TPA: class I SAM-dependent methyltransferase [Pyrinomonadaceae bacterium]
MTQHDEQHKQRCPACDSGTGTQVGQKNGVSMLRCQNCATLYAMNYPESSSSDNYEGYYDEHNLTVPAFVHRQLRTIIARFDPFRQTNRLLDIGCGSGVLLKAACAAGWEAEGLEVSGPAVKHIRGMGFTVFHGELADALYPTAHFDVVTASELLEHVPDPQALVAEVVRILRPGGLFWATTPHGRGASARLLGTRWSVVCPPEHLHLFSLSGMRGLLKTAGFSHPRILTHGVNPFEIWSAVRNRRQPAENGAGGEGEHDRVASSYQLNEMFTKNQLTRALKATFNGVLGLTRMGDSLKIWAVK